MVNERERGKVYSAHRQRFLAAIGACHASRKTTSRTAVSRDSTGNFVNFNLYPCPPAPVHPFKCHANAATNAPTKSR